METKLLRVPVEYQGRRLSCECVYAPFEFVHAEEKQGYEDAPELCQQERWKIVYEGMPLEDSKYNGSWSLSSFVREVILPTIDKKKAEAINDLLLRRGSASNICLYEDAAREYDLKYRDLVETACRENMSYELGYMWYDLTSTWLRKRSKHGICKINCIQEIGYQGATNELHVMMMYDCLRKLTGLHVNAKNQQLSFRLYTTNVAFQQTIVRLPWCMAPESHLYGNGTIDDCIDMLRAAIYYRAWYEISNKLPDKDRIQIGKWCRYMHYLKRSTREDIARDDLKELVVLPPVEIHAENENDDAVMTICEDATPDTQFAFFWAVILKYMFYQSNATEFSGSDSDTSSDTRSDTTDKEEEEVAEVNEVKGGCMHQTDQLVVIWAMRQMLPDGGHMALYAVLKRAATFQSIWHMCEQIEAKFFDWSEDGASKDDLIQFLVSKTLDADLAFRCKQSWKTGEKCALANEYRRDWEDQMVLDRKDKPLTLRITGWIAWDCKNLNEICAMHTDTPVHGGAPKHTHRVVPTTKRTMPSVKPFTAIKQVRIIKKEFGSVNSGAKASGYRREYPIKMDVCPYEYKHQSESGRMNKKNKNKKRGNVSVEKRPAKKHHKRKLTK